MDTERKGEHSLVSAHQWEGGEEITGGEEDEEIGGFLGDGNQLMWADKRSSTGNSLL